MCGIVGVCSPYPVDSTRLAAALQSLRRRGPDSEGVWWTTDRKVGLGHRRLAINDPEGGAQPIVSDRFITNLNGEFYGLPDLYRNLSDSQALPDYLAENSLSDTLRSLNGEFAGLVYDRGQERFFAFRDRFGIKPLYWCKIGEELWFASKPSALLAAGASLSWCEKSFAQAAATQYPLPGKTMFSGVQSIKPGHYLTIEKGRVTENCYWKLPQSISSTRPHNLRTSLEKAVRLRLREGHQNSVLLSGGIDSASVLALAALSGEKIVAYSADFPDHRASGFSEVRLAAAQAKHCRVPHRVVEVTTDDILGSLPQVVRSLEGLVVNGHAVAKWRLSEAVREDGCRVSLSGEGADELLFGYRHFAPYFSHSQINVEDPAGLGILVTRTPSEPLPPDWPVFFAAKYQLGRKIAAFLALPLDPNSAFQKILDNTETTTALEIAREAWVKTALSSYILETLGDGAEMAHSVEGRPPFLDHTLWEESAGSPPKDNQKSALREAARGLVIPEILNKPKHPFMAGPLGDNLLSQAEAVISDTSHPFVDKKQALPQLRKLLTLNPDQRLEWEPAVLWVLSSYYLQEIWS